MYNVSHTVKYIYQIFSQYLIIQPVTAYDIQINCLLYADDMVLLSESQSGLQMCLNKLNSYCQKWKLTANTEKAKL